MIDKNTNPRQIPNIGKNMQSPLLTYAQVAELLQVSDRTVFTLVKTGKLKKVKIGHSVRIEQSDLREFINRSKHQYCSTLGETIAHRNPE